METPARNPRRCEVPTWLLSPPSSRSAFPATASASAAAGADVDQAVSEYPLVTLLEWWLAKVEGDERKIAVGGTFERNQTVQEFPPAPIAKRHQLCVLETEDGIVLRIYGLLNYSRMQENGFSTQVCQKFVTGFPQSWQSCNLLFPKVTSPHTGCQPSSSDTNSSEVDSTKFYLEQFQLGKRLHLRGTSLISELLDRIKKSSSNLSNGSPRFEECTSDDDSAINENLAALNDDTERHEASCSEVDNLEVDAGRTLRERGHNDIDTNAPSMLTVACANDAGNEEADNAPMTSTCNRRTPVAATIEDIPTSVCLDAQNTSDLSNGIPRHEEGTCIKNGIPIPEECTCTNGIPTNGKAAASNDKPAVPPKKQRSAREKTLGATRSQVTRSPSPYGHGALLTRGRATSMSMSSPEDLKLKKTRSGRVVVPTLDGGSQRIVYDMDGLISGVIGLDLPQTHKGSGPRTDLRKKRRAD